jgi:hypothetical protein
MNGIATQSFWEKAGMRARRGDRPVARQGTRTLSLTHFVGEGLVIGAENLHD